MWWPYTCTILIFLKVLYSGEQLLQQVTPLGDFFLVHRTPLMDNFGLGNLSARMRLSWNYTSLKFHSIFFPSSFYRGQTWPMVCRFSLSILSPPFLSFTDISPNHYLACTFLRIRTDNRQYREWCQKSDSKMWFGK